MSKDIGSALTEGLISGYAGGKPGDLQRADFVGKVSHIESGGAIYHDEWFVPSHIGGGQELVRINNEAYTRLYAGGTPEEAELNALGITEKDVSRYLKEKIIELGEMTRLFEDCTPERDGDWQYAYRVTSTDQSIGVTTGMESIEYQDKKVHIHAFIIAPLQ